MELACKEVAPRLVAWQDGELSRSEASQVADHVGGCVACARAHHRLALSLPLPPPPPPDRVRARLAAALDVDAILAAAEQPEVPAPLASSWAAWCWASFLRPSSVPHGAVLVYLALLAATFGWGASNWWALHHPPPTPAISSGGEIPAHQFRPAAYDPEVDGSMMGDRTGDGPAAASQRPR